MRLPTEPTLFELSAPFSGTWPTSGSMRNGMCSVHPMSGPRTSGSAFSSSLGLLPTPTTSEWNGPGAPDGNRNDTLRARIANLPTPRARDSKGVGFEDGLPAVVQLLKTPTAQLAVNGGSQHPDKRKRGGHGPTLADEVEHLLPTPRALDGAKGAVSRTASTERRVREGKANLPEMVLSAFPVTLSSGDSTPRRSSAGKRSRTVRHPGQLTIEAA